jgi:broad specificity phosphatase PhoE
MHLRKIKWRMFRKMKTRLILVKHAKAWNSDVKLVSHGNQLDLTKEGIKQAEDLLDHIKEEIDLLYTGTDLKSVSTGKVISQSKRVPLTINDELDDLYTGEWEGKSIEEIMRDYPEQYQTWLKVPYEMEFPKGETVDQFKNRVIGKLRSIINRNDGKTILYVTCDYPINLLISYFRGMDYQKLSFVHKFEDASVYRVEIENGRFKFV